jgi:Tfp pilus assembly protein PilN
VVHDVVIVTAVLASLSAFATAVCAGARRATESARTQDRIERLEKEQEATAALLEEIKNKLENKRRR